MVSSVTSSLSAAPRPSPPADGARRRAGAAPVAADDAPADAATVGEKRARDDEAAEAAPAEAAPAEAAPAEAAPLLPPAADPAAVAA